VITDVEVENYQAIEKASLRLGRFTVVTGPTGSGKSAVIRAIKLVVFNARGTSYIRHGAKACKAALGFQGEIAVVGIERGGRGSDKYRLVTLDLDPARLDQPVVAEFTKLAGQVPPEVQAVLHLGEVNFAGQFDGPYLLGATGAQVARTLGELTNITLLFDAAREANRRKQDTSRQLKTAEQELAFLVAQAASFRTLAVRREAALEARERLASIDLMHEQIDRLHKLASEVARRTTELGIVRDWVSALEVPSAERVTFLHERLMRLRELSASIATWQQDKERNDGEAESAEILEVDARLVLHELLVEAGTCPTCGQAVSEA
jgi:DNA repair protein SbcC/Rad50